MQMALVAAAVMISLRNSIRSQSQVRAFWLLVFAGNVLWLASLMAWSVYELWLRQPVPDSPLVDTLLFVRLVPFTLAAALQPEKADSRFRAFGLLDLCILMMYSLYLFAIFVYAYRLPPVDVPTYNFHFTVAELIANQLFVVVAAAGLFGERGPWKRVFLAFFFAAATYSLASDLGNVAIDEGHYYTGSLYDVPLATAMAGFVAMCIVGASIQGKKGVSDPGEERAGSAERHRFLLSHLTVLVTLSTPAIGLWLLAVKGPRELMAFRLEVTLVTICLLTLLLSIKQNLLGANLMGTLEQLSRTYESIERFRGHLVQSEKLTSLGRLVASVANEIKDAMTRIREQARAIMGRSAADSRPASLAGKIDQYAQRTDALVEKMLRFAQETSLQIAPLDVKSLVESALHLSRAAKNPGLRLSFGENGEACPPVLGDSSQLLHVFVQLLSNAMDALEGIADPWIEIAIRRAGAQVLIEFADNGPGVEKPQHLFEPFYTTKPVGKGTGLGLSTCYGIVQQHQGEIAFRARPGGGAVFTVFLPAAPIQGNPAEELTAMQESAS